MIYSFTLGTLIKQKRLIEGHTQIELARAIGISKSLLSRVERGLAFPSIRILMDIAQSLSINQHDLLVCAAYTALNNPDIVSDSVLSEILATLKSLRCNRIKAYAAAGNDAGGKR